MRAVARRIRHPAAASACILLGALWPSPALLDPVRGAPVADWSLHADARYLGAAPLHAVLDEMTLLTLPQHVALLLTVALLGAWSGLRIGGGSMPRRPWATRKAGGTGAALALGGMLALCAWGVYGERPMRRLAGGGPDHIVVDFHAHTEASHDARTGWSERRLRDWLAAAGFDAAYVTDHGVLWPADWRHRSRGPSGDDPVRLLPGNEVRGMGEHLNILGATGADSTLFWDDARRAQLDALHEALASRVDPPVVLLTSPVKRTEALDRGLLTAVEISDAAPRALAFGWRERAWLQRLADSLQLVRVSGSDLHGYGRAAAAWTVLEIAGWRGLDGASLDRAIRRVLHGRGTPMPLVLERPPLVGTGHGWGVALTAPLLLHAVLTRLSWRERWAWLAWSWATWVAWQVTEVLRRVLPGYMARAGGARARRRRLLRLTQVWWRRRARVAAARVAAP